MNITVSERMEKVRSAKTGTTVSYKSACTAKCAECMGAPEVGWRDCIRNCTSYSCPLYPVRPYK